MELVTTRAIRSHEELTAHYLEWNTLIGCGSGVQTADEDATPSPTPRRPRRARSPEAPQMSRSSPEAVAPTPDVQLPPPRRRPIPEPVSPEAPRRWLGPEQASSSRVHPLHLTSLPALPQAQATRSTDSRLDELIQLQVRMVALEEQRQMQTERCWPMS